MAKNIIEQKCSHLGERIDAKKKDKLTHHFKLQEKQMDTWGNSFFKIKKHNKDQRQSKWFRDSDVQAQGL